MKALKARRRYDEEKAEEAWKKRQEEEESRVAAMPLEERKEYEANKARRQREAVQLIHLMTSIGGPYTANRGFLI